MGEKVLVCTIRFAVIDLATINFNKETKVEIRLIRPVSKYLGG